MAHSLLPPARPQREGSFALRTTPSEEEPLQSEVRSSDKSQGRFQRGSTVVRTRAGEGTARTPLRSSEELPQKGVLGVGILVQAQGGLRACPGCAWRVRIDANQPGLSRHSLGSGAWVCLWKGSSGGRRGERDPRHLPSISGRPSPSFRCKIGGGAETPHTQPCRNSSNQNPKKRFCLGSRNHSRNLVCESFPMETTDVIGGRLCLNRIRSKFVDAHIFPATQLMAARGGVLSDVGRQGKINTGGVKPLSPNSLDTKHAC